MKIEINIMKKHLYVIVAMFVLVLGVVGVVAYGVGNPKLNGHTVNEIEGFDAAVAATAKTTKVDSAVRADSAANSDKLGGKTLAEVQASQGGCQKLAEVARAGTAYPAVPDKCKNGATCTLVLKQQAYNFLTRVYYWKLAAVAHYSQESDNIWGSLFNYDGSTNTLFSSGKNGDTARGNIMYVGNYVYLYDDYSSSANNPNLFALYGASPAQLWVC